MPAIDPEAVGAAFDRIVASIATMWDARAAFRERLPLANDLNAFDTLCLSNGEITHAQHAKLVERISAAIATRTGHEGMALARLLRTRYQPSAAALHHALRDLAASFALPVALGFLRHDEDQDQNQEGEIIVGSLKVGDFTLLGAASSTPSEARRRLVGLADGFAAVQRRFDDAPPPAGPRPVHHRVTAHTLLDGLALPKDLASPFSGFIRVDSDRLDAATALALAWVRAIVPAAALAKYGKPGRPAWPASARIEMAAIYSVQPDIDA